MSNLKIERVNGAYDRLRISGLTIEPSGEDITLGLNRLENMMAEFSGANMDVGYNFEEEPDANSDSGIQRKFFEFVDTNLAVRMAPDFNKVVPELLIRQASASYANASGMVAADNIQNVQYSRRMPMGKGNERGFNPGRRFYYPSTQAPNEAGVTEIIVGDINDYFYNFEAYLDVSNGEEIDTFEISADSTLVIVSSSNDETQVSYRLQVPDQTTRYSQFYQTKCIITTTEGRKRTQTQSFKVVDLTKAGEPS